MKFHNCHHADVLVPFEAIKLQAFERKLFDFPPFPKQSQIFLDFQNLQLYSPLKWLIDGSFHSCSEGIRWSLPLKKFYLAQIVLFNRNKNSSCHGYNSLFS